MSESKNKIIPWRKTESKDGPDLLLFKARYDYMENPRTGNILKRIVLETKEWVNVVAITPEKKIILVKQYRFGSGKITIEIPAGLIDEGEDSGASAIRELQEETGYTTQNWQYLGYVEPNPAFLNNKCHHWLALDVTKTTEPNLDDGEDIGVDLYSFEELADAIREGVVNHVLALSALSRIPEFWQHLSYSDFLK